MNSTRPAKRYRAPTIAEELRFRILNGELKDRIPTEHELAREFNVARSTVVRSLRAIELEGLVWCKRGEGRFVVQPSQRRRTATIGVVVHDMSLLSYPTTAQYLDGVQQACLAADYHMQLLGFNPQVDHNGLQQVLDQLDPSRLDGVVLMTWLVPEERIVQLSRRIPVVWMSRVATSPRIGTVSSDIVGANFEATNHLLGLGHRDLLLVTIGADKLQGWQQREGMRIAMLQQVQSGKARWRVISSRTNPTDEWSDEFRKLMATSDRPTAIIFGSQELAATGIALMQRMKLQIPKDVSSIVTNDVLHPPQVPVPMTAIRLHLGEVGRQAVQMLIRMITDPTATQEPRYIPAELIVRDSTAAPSKRI